MSTPHPAWTRASSMLRLASPAAGPVVAEVVSTMAAGTGRGVRVAILDSGVDADHPALAGAVDRDAGVVVHLDGETATVVPEPHGDLFGHGTACAGIIHQLAPEATLVSVRVLGADLAGRVAAFHAGLSWALDNGFDVINLSLGARKRTWALAFHELCDRAYFQGSAVVTAANNTRGDSFPSLYSSVFSVACTTTADPERYHANPEPPTEFLARGIDVPVLWLGGGRSVGTGNSYAAPHITGMIARILSAWPGLRPFQVKGLLWEGAANIREAGPADPAGRLTQQRSRTTLASTGRRTRMTRSQTTAGAVGHAR